MYYYNNINTNNNTLNNNIINNESTETLINNLVYNINGNNLTCIATSIQSENDNIQNINAEFTFKAIHNSGIQLVNITGNPGIESHVLEINNKYILP